MTIESTAAAPVDASGRECQGDDCPLRSTAENDAFGYCGGCPGRERQCPGCGEFKAQVGWWWGSVRGRIDRWCCPSCRSEPLDAATAAKYPHIAETHPLHAETVAEFARFRVNLGDLDDAARFAVAAVLARSAQMSDSPILADLAACLRDGRPVDVDTSSLTMEQRRNALLALSNATYSSHTPQNLTGELARLMRGWESWLDGQAPPRSGRAMTDAQRAAETRAASLRGRERPVQ